jgi:hypothetical protein
MQHERDTSVSKRTNAKKPANLRNWRVIIMRSKGEYHGPKRLIARGPRL